MNTHRKSEKGQVLILLVAGLVVFLGFTALAIDGGMVYSDRRFDQSVSDSSALAGAGMASQAMDDDGIMYSNFSCGSIGGVVNEAIDAAIERSESNTVSLDEDASDNQFVEVTCNDSPDELGYVDKYLDVHVRVTTEVKTAFAHLVFGGTLKNTTDATVRVRPVGPAVAGYALYALDPNCSEDGINLSGTVDVFIHNGSAFSRSCIQGNGNTSLTAYDGGQVNCLRNPAHPGWCSAADTHFNPRLSPVDRDPWTVDIPIPDCQNSAIAPDREVGGEDEDGYITLDPGYYEDLPGHAKLRLRPGLYCISGNVKLNGGGNIESIEEDGLAGVTVVFMNGSYEAKGNGGMQMHAPRPDQPMTHAPNVVPGLVLAFAHGNHNALDLGGNSQSQFSGTVYVPDGSIVVGGTGDVNHATQFIAYNFWTHGNSQTQIYYDGGQFFPGPAKMEMLR